MTHVRVNAAMLRELLAAARKHKESVKDGRRAMVAKAATEAVEAAVKRATGGRGEEFLDFVIEMDAKRPLLRRRHQLGGGTGRGALLKADELNE